MTNFPTSASSPHLDTSSSSRFDAYKGYGGGELSELDVTSTILKGHESMMNVLTSRGRNIEIIHKMWQGKDAKAGEKDSNIFLIYKIIVDEIGRGEKSICFPSRTKFETILPFFFQAVDQAVSLRDPAVLVDVLSVISLRPSIWNLDLCTALLPPIGELLQSKYET